VSAATSHLRCTSCDTESTHVVVYVGDLATRIRCTRCGALTTLDVSDDYLPELSRRIRTKARRMRPAPGDRLADVAASYPFRALTKPVRIAAELVAVAGSRLRRRR
jgi:hypothetical protein